MNMDALLTKVEESIVMHVDEKFSEKKVRYLGSNVKLPAIDLDRTRINLNQAFTSQPKDKEFLLTITKAVNYMTDIFNKSHDGFRIVKKTNGKSLTVSGVYKLSIGLSMLLEECKGLERNKEKIVICVIKPGVQDGGKNIIKLVLEVEGYLVVDAGSNVSPEDLLENVKTNKPDMVAISCMRNDSLEYLEKFLFLMNEEKMSMPVLIGGISVNANIAFELSEKYHTKVRYGKNTCDVISATEKALSNVFDLKKEPTTTEVCKKIIVDPVAFEKEICIYEISMNQIAVNKDARNGCLFCDGSKKENCPLELGFEKQSTINESRNFISKFNLGLLIVWGFSPDNIELSRKMWEQLFAIEDFYREISKVVYGFRPPAICPFCSEKECSIKKGFCRQPTNYRPVLESLNINIFDTLQGCFGETYPRGLYSLVLIKK